MLHTDKLKNKNYVVVGAGFSGSVIARELAEAGARVTVIEKRPHIAGNAYDYKNVYGIRVHEYGPHLFHTNNKNVVDYLSKFTKWVPYVHRVKALHEDMFVPFPVNSVTRDMIGISDDNYYVDNFYRKYTKKMWGYELEELDKGIVSRVPMREDDEDRYFPNDEYQFLPDQGYTELVRRMLDHKNILVLVKTDFSEIQNVECDHIFNSMPIDQYYDFRFGELPYRSIKFHTRNIPIPTLYNEVTVNFTDEGPYTRVTEWKHLPNTYSPMKYHTTITVEEPCDYKDNNNERYYPVKDINGKNREIYEKYKAIPNEKMTFIGRTGLYTYLDMHQAVNIALQTSKKFIEEEIKNND